MNSINLFNHKKKYDLIWIDGAHGYPVVCSDITNAISMSQENTIIMCDDVWKNIKTSDKIYSSIAAWETLESFQESGILENYYFRKRLGKKFLGSQKFISLSRLKSCLKYPLALFSCNQEELNLGLHILHLKLHILLNLKTHPSLL